MINHILVLFEGSYNDILFHLFQIKFNVYKFYFSAIGIGFLLAFSTMYILYQVFSILSNVWLLKWSTDKSSSSTSTDNKYFYFEIYIVLGLMEGMVKMSNKKDLRNKVSLFS